MASAFSLFTSLRYDVELQKIPSLDMKYAGWNNNNMSPFYMLDFHRDRVLNAAIHWGFEPVIDLLTGPDGLEYMAQKALQFLGDERKPQRLRIVLSPEGEISFVKSDAPLVPPENLLPAKLTTPGSIPELYEAKRDNPFELVVDGDHTQKSEYTHFKTTKRAMYDSARERASIQLGQRKEVLIVDDQGVIMEGSITTPYFWRNGKWVTPPVSLQYSAEDGCGGQCGTTRRWALERYV